MVLRHDDLAVGIENGKSGYAFDRNTILMRDLEIGVHTADIDVYLNEVLLQQLGVRRLVEVDVKNLAIATPVATKVQQDTLVCAFSFDQCGVEVMLRSADVGVQVFSYRRRRHLRAGMWDCGYTGAHGQSCQQRSRWNESQLLKNCHLNLLRGTASYHPSKSEIRKQGQRCRGGY